MMTKRQDLPAGLWIVATPIGNLQDLSPRARQALEEAEAIFCEDTRRTASLLAALGIAGVKGRPVLRLDAHASERAISEAIARLETGQSCALVTDAGTPGISDPGSRLVSRAQRAGIRVTPVPGPSALMALLSVAGFEETAFTFRGFFPRKKGEIEKEIALATDSRLSRLHVWFESPNRIAATLELIAGHLPEDSRVVVAKELTKIHERIFAGNPGEARDQVSGELEREGELGEWCIAVLIPESASHDEGKRLEWFKTLHCLIECAVSPSISAEKVSQYFGVSRNEAYRAAIKITSQKK